MSAEWQSRRRLPQPASLSTRAQRAAHSDTVAAAGSETASTSLKSPADRAERPHNPR